MRAFFEVGATQPAAAAAPPPGAASDAERFELDLLRDQLGRMRGMLYRFTHEFFRTIHLWAVVSIALLVAGSIEGWRAAAVLVPFVVPFAFLETAYLFYYTVYARRHAERLEQALNDRLGHEVLAAHRTEAAYFYPPDRPKIAFLSFGNPLGMASAMTVGYTVGAAILWAAGSSSRSTSSPTSRPRASSASSSLPSWGGPPRSPPGSSDTRSSGATRTGSSASLPPRTASLRRPPSPPPRPGGPAATSSAAGPSMPDAPDGAPRAGAGDA